MLGRASLSSGWGTTVDVLPSVASEGILAWQLLASIGAGRCSSAFAAGAGPLRNSKWSRGSKVVMLSSLTDLLRLLRARRLLTAALPSASNSFASGVEHPRASTIGTELLLCLCVLGRGLPGGEVCRLSIIVSEVGESRLRVPGHGSGSRGTKQACTEERAPKE